MLKKDIKALIVRVPSLLFPDMEEKVDLTSSQTLSFSIPLGAIYLATYARKIGGHDVEILDLNISLKLDRQRKEGKGSLFDPLETVKREMIYIVGKLRPRIIGFSALFLHEDKWVSYCSEIIKGIDDKIITVVGGSLATVDTDRILANRYVDYAVLGEGEVIFNNFLDCYPDRTKLSKLKGIAHKKSGRIFVNEREGLISDLDSIPMPDLGLVPLRAYPQDVTNGIYLFTSRGCPFRCSFCSAFRLWGRSIRYHSPERVLDEVKRLQSVYGVTDFLIADDNFTLDHARVKKISLYLENENKKNGFSIRWRCINGMMIETLNPEIVKMMQGAGCREFSFAVESGSRRVAEDILHKPIDYEKALMLRSLIKDLGAAVLSLYMVGLPGETIKEMCRTVKFIKQLDSDWNTIAIYLPTPGTELHERIKEMTVPDNARRVRSLATFSTIDFSKEDVKKTQYDANMRYNFFRNRNVLRYEGNLQTEFYRDILKHVVTAYPKHNVGKITLAYTYWLDRMNKEAEFWWRSAEEDLKDPAVLRDFGPYLEQADEKPVRKWREFLATKERVT